MGQCVRKAGRAEGRPRSLRSGPDLDLPTLTACWNHQRRFWNGVHAAPGQSPRRSPAPGWRSSTSLAGGRSRMRQRRRFPRAARSDGERLLQRILQGHHCRRSNGSPLPQAPPGSRPAPVRQSARAADPAGCSPTNHRRSQVRSGGSTRRRTRSCSDLAEGHRAGQADSNCAVSNFGHHASRIWIAAVCSKAPSLSRSRRCPPSAIHALSLSIAAVSSGSETAHRFEHRRQHLGRADVLRGRFSMACTTCASVAFFPPLTAVCNFSSMRLER